MNNLISEILSFTLNPRKIYGNESFSTRKKFIDVWDAIKLYFTFAFIVLLPMFFLNKFIHYFFSLDVLNTRNAYMKKAINTSHVIVITALIGPTVEEILFRLWLTFKKPYIFLSLIAISLVGLIKFNNHYIYTLKVDVKFYRYLIEAIISGIVFWGIFNLSFFRNLSNKYFKCIYWASCIGFGLIHLGNFTPLKLNIIWAYPFFILPQLFFGFILGYIRIKNGFFWALLIHCLVNLPLSLIPL
jgi:hypothetical protein